MNTKKQIMPEQEDKYPDQIFKKDHLTTMEKLLFANKYVEVLKKDISELNQKIGVLESEKSELNDIITGYMTDSKTRALQKENEQLKKSVSGLTKKIDELLKSERKEFVEKKALQELIDLRTRNKALQKDNRELVTELAQYKYAKK